MRSRWILAQRRIPSSLHFRCRTHQLLGHYDDAIHDCELATARESWFDAWVWLTAAYAQKGELAKAQAAKVALLKRNAGYSIARAKLSRISDNPTYLQQAETHLYAGLRKAGIQDEWEITTLCDCPLVADSV